MAKSTKSYEERMLEMEKKEQESLEKAKRYVFEERTFKEMSRLNGLSEDRCKGIYYYAIKKIRKMMGGRR